MLTCCLAATEPQAEITHVFASVQLQHYIKALCHFHFRVLCVYEGVDAFKSKMNSKQIQYEEDFRKTN